MRNKRAFIKMNSFLRELTNIIEITMIERFILSSRART